ncbi:MAG: hypothetical protein QXJ81_06610 [Metallosphaera sp.]
MIIFFSGIASLQISKSDVDYLFILPISPRKIYYAVFLVTMMGLSLISAFIYLLTLDVVTALAFTIGIPSISMVSTLFIKKFQLLVRLTISGLLSVTYLLTQQQGNNTGISLFLLESLGLFVTFLVQGFRVNTTHFTLTVLDNEEKKRRGGEEPTKIRTPLHFHFLTFSIIITLASMGSPGAYRIRVKLRDALTISALTSLLLYFIPYKGLLIGYLILTAPLIFISGFFIISLLGEERLWLGFQDYRYVVKVILLRGIVISLLLVPYAIALWLNGLSNYAIAMIPINFLAYILYLRIIPYSYPNVQKIFSGEQPVYISLSTIINPLIVTLLIASLGLIISVMPTYLVIILTATIMAVSILFSINKKFIEGYINELANLGYE